MASSGAITKKSQIPKPGGKQIEHLEAPRVYTKARRSYEGTVPGLSLQGPFKPNIVAAVSAKHGERLEEPKRKRDGSGPNRRASGSDVTDRRKASGGKVRSPDSGDFLTTHNPDVPRPKRNQVKEQQKCKVEYSTKAKTAFAETSHPKFTASAPAARQSRDHHKPTVTKGYRELQRSEELLQKKVSGLEIKVKGLEQLQKKTSQLEKENVDLQKRLEDEENTHQETKEKLETKIDSCMKKLEDCQIDPVTLETDSSLDERSIVNKRREAEDSCNELSSNLNKMNERCKEILTDINNIEDEEEEE